MDYPVPELIDRAAIFAIKVENGLPLESQRDLFFKAVPLTEIKNYQTLVKIHSKIWNKEEEITASYAKKDFATAGKLYNEIRDLNVVRMKIKNSIGSRYKDFQDRKNFPTFQR